MSKEYFFVLSRPSRLIRRPKSDSESKKYKNKIFIILKQKIALVKIKSLRDEYVTFVKSIVLRKNM